MAFKLSRVLCIWQACAAFAEDDPFHNWTAPGHNPFANLFKPPKPDAHPFALKKPSLAKVMSSTHLSSKSTTAVCLPSECNSEAEQCQALQSDEYAKNGCKAFAQGWQAGDFACTDCSAVPRTFLRFDEGECIELCYTLYENNDHSKICKAGCDWMQDNSKHCCEVPIKNIYMTVRGLKYSVLTQIPMMMETVMWMVSSKVSEALSVPREWVDVHHYTSANHAFDLTATVTSISGQELGNPNGDLGDSIRRGLVAMPAALKAKISRIDVTGNQCIYPA